MKRSFLIAFAAVVFVTHGIVNATMFAKSLYNEWWLLSWASEMLIVFCVLILAFFFIGNFHDEYSEGHKSLELTILIFGGSMGLALCGGIVPDVLANGNYEVGAITTLIGVVAAADAAIAMQANLRNVEANEFRAIALNEAKK